jgi:aminoglycoside phosphotransferase family enzyme
MDQEAVVKALMNPDAYDVPPEQPIKLIETHISYIFLTGKYAYKVKKDVVFDFLDFSALESRKYYCEHELKLNQRIAPEMYLEVLPVTEQNGEVRIGGTGTIVEYVLKMIQLPPDGLMTDQLERGEVTQEIVDQLAASLVKFHEKAETNSEISAHASPVKIADRWREQFDQIEEFVGIVIGRRDFDFVKETVETFIETHKSLLLQRIMTDRIKRCHGDLHSGNIFVIDGRPQIFDCLEFNEAYASIDTMAEVAFFAMDMDYHGRTDLADYFIEKYIEYSGDTEGKRLLTFYKAYYATVRGMVTSLRLKEKMDADARNPIREKARRYFNLTIEYAKTLAQ